MFKNNLKIALRNILKNKVFSLINIIGLSIGLSAAFVIGAIIYYDMTFDKFHSDSKRIYRITTAFLSPEGDFYNAGVTVPLAGALSDLNMPELETVAPFFTAYPLRVENKKLDFSFKNPEFVIYADDDYFRTLDYIWLAGTQKEALSAPNTVVLSEARAQIYFPDQELTSLIGKTLIYNDTIPALVTGIVANFTQRTDLVFEEFLSLKTADVQDMTSAVVDAHWHNTNSASQLFVKLTPNASKIEVQKVLDGISKEHEAKERVAIGRSNSFYMQPLSDLHFDSNYNTFDFDDQRASLLVLRNLGLVALFLLLLGCINFINLNTAQASQRAKEIGIRKTLGSSKKQLIFQFLGETLLLTMAAGALSLVLANGLLGIFSDYIPAGIDLSLYYDALPILGIVTLLLIVTLLSGFYPALILSGYKPISVLKNEGVKANQRAGLRKYLTVFQFSIAQIFIIATLLVGKQLHYIMKKDMGFKTDAIAYFYTPWSDPAPEKKERFIAKLEALPMITEVTLGGNPPASFSTHSMGVLFQQGDQEVNSDLQLIYGDADYFNIYGLQLLAGRLPLNDTIREYVVNQTYLKQLGIENPESIIGKTFKADDENHPIVGVMQDFHQRSLKTKIEPMAFTGDTNGSRRSQFRVVSFKLATEHSSQWPETIAQIESIWKGIYPASDFEHRFMDDTIERFYAQERKVSVLLRWATGLVILISCLGLLGLVMYTTQRRIKEIGIRKVVGASLLQLNMLLCKEFLMVVGVAFLIAIPIAWWGMYNWLQGFAFKTNMSWWVFVGSGLAMLVIALIIISIRTIAAARVNPVKSLRSE
ncbi:ABC transporter permease [Maribacter antarcticus]|uniref:ABC transporter permease n=1 Tax=Maribacter antarcticus TaxID=505250 RepID=UPI00047ED409|nr:FtsX-like permease family protein [Maribacter antarcticus]